MNLQPAITPKVNQLPEPNYFGDCSTCHQNDGCLNVGKTHWYVCHTHKVRWMVGANLFDSWRHETQEDWQRNAEKIGDYQEIEALHRWTPPENNPNKAIEGKIFPF